MSDTRDRNLENKSPDELEHDIEETRARIRDEMDALGHKLGPEGLRDSAEDALDDTQQAVVNVTEQLRKGVVESSDSIGGRLSAFIKQNPVPATLFGIGLAWLLKQGQESRGYTGGSSYRGSSGGSSSSRSRDESRSRVVGTGSRSSSPSSRTSRGGTSSSSTSSRITSSSSTPSSGTSSSTKDDNAIVANVPGPSSSTSSSASSGRGAKRTGAADGASGGEDEAFRSHYESNFSANGDYDDYEPAYRYGFDLASESEFQGKPWNDSRSDIKRRWDEERNEPWYKFDQAVEHGYTTAQSRR